MQIEDAAVCWWGLPGLCWFAGVCTGLPGFMLVYWGLHWFAGVCTGLPGFALVCRGLYWFAGVCTGLPEKSARVKEKAFPPMLPNF